jgi:quinol monooxygenase YgiN
MVTHGLLVRLHAQSGKEDELAQFLQSAQPLVKGEPDTAAWFGVKFGHNDYGIFDAFPNESGRDAHLAGPVAVALNNQGKRLLDKDPRIEKVGILASKLPAAGYEAAKLTKGVFLTFKAKKGHEMQVEQFLRDAQNLVAQEPGTIAWFALQLEGNVYGIFDVFPDSSARTSHLTGHVPRELTKHALSLLGGVPHMDMLDVLAANFAERTTLVGLGVD